MNSRLRALRVICNISSDDGEDFFAAADELLDDLCTCVRVGTLVASSLNGSLFCFNFNGYDDEK